MTADSPDSDGMQGCRGIPACRSIPASRSILRCRTPETWLAAATQALPMLLIDHAHCERKAAATALSLMQRHGDRPEMNRALSRLAREELRHFEQVLGLLGQFGIPLRPLPAGRYARALFSHVRAQGSERSTDVLVVGALIEARSAERFERLHVFLAGAPGGRRVAALGLAAAALFERLHAAEVRHFETYLQMAADFSPPDAVERRVQELAAIERDLIESTDGVLRFHSGPPHVATSAH